jgi:hypothetical protein
MTDAASPFPVANVEPELEAVRAHWQSLIRGANQMPFWDDFVPSALPRAEDQLFLMDVFDKPPRFRFSSTVAAELERRFGDEVRGLFADEIPMRTPFEYLNAQCHATVEGQHPTYYRGSGYERLLLPMWGEGRIGMLLGVFAWS